MRVSGQAFGGKIQLSIPNQWDRGADGAGDTILHSWEVLADILQSEEAQDIVCDIGM